MRRSESNKWNWNETKQNNNQKEKDKTTKKSEIPEEIQNPFRVVLVPRWHTSPSDSFRNRSSRSFFFRGIEEKRPVRNSETSFLKQKISFFPDYRISSFPNYRLSSTKEHPLFIKYRRSSSTREDPPFFKHRFSFPKHRRSSCLN